jgi:hypothetical protein
MGIMKYAPVGKAKLFPALHKFFITFIHQSFAILMLFVRFSQIVGCIFFFTYSIAWSSMATFA